MTTRRERRAPRASFAGSVLVPVLGGSLVGWLANRSAREQYRRLKQPSFAPPGAVFPVVWTTLYAMMGTADYRVKQATGRASSLPAYQVQLGLNFLWSFLFFRWGLRGTALVEMTVLLGAIALTLYEFQQVDRAAGALLVPYFGWVLFALALNYKVWELNR